MQSAGISVAGLLGVLFVALKLIGVITWPWIWVLAPFWAGLAIILLILLFFGIGALIVFLVARQQESKARKRRKKKK